MSYNASRTARQTRTSETKKGRELIMQSAARVLDYEVGYRLYQIKRGGKSLYQIYSGYRRDRVYCSAGGNRQTAENIFAAVVKGKVTPCTLRCIVSDLLPEDESEMSEVCGLCISE